MSTQTTTATTNTPKKEAGHFRRNWFFYTLIVLALGAAAFFWFSKSMALAKQAKDFETEKAALIVDTEKVFAVNSEQHLVLTMKTFAWAVRSELNRGNQEQVDQYFQQLVKADKVEEITLVDREGTILLTTNKKNEGSKFVEEYADAVMQVEATTVMDFADKRIAAAPIMSLTSRTGTLVVRYKIDRLPMNGK